MTRSVPDILALPADLREGLDRLAAATVAPFGPPPLAELVETHFIIFAELRQRGAQWAQIAALLEVCGIVGGNGAFSDGVVRATYARVVKGRRTANGKHTQRNATKENGTERNAARRSASKRDATKHGVTKRGVTKRGAPKHIAAKHDGTDRGVAERNDVKREDVKRDATGEARATPSKSSLRPTR